VTRSDQDTGRRFAEAFGCAIRVLREGRGMNRAELAERACGVQKDFDIPPGEEALDLDEEFVGRVEAGEQDPLDFDTEIALTVALGFGFTEVGQLMDHFLRKGSG
jgi:hypothetical protein